MANALKDKIVLLDQDGVLAHFDLEHLNRWRERYPDEVYVPLEERKNFYAYEDFPQHLRAQVREVYTEKGFFLSLPPIEGAIEGVREMMSLGADVRICTSPLSDYEHCVGEKFAWIENYLGRDMTKKIIITKDKTLVRGDFLVDDRPSITGALTPVWEHIIFDQPYNRTIKERGRMDWSNWKEVLL